MSGVTLHGLAWARRHVVGSAPVAVPERHRSLCDHLHWVGATTLALNGVDPRPRLASLAARCATEAARCHEVATSYAVLGEDPTDRRRPC